MTLGPNPSPAALHDLALAALSAGRPAEAADHMARAVLLAPTQARYHRELGELSRRLGRLPQAIACGIAATKLAPRDVEAHYQLGLAHADAGDLPKAILSYRKAVKLDPRHGLAWEQLGAALTRQGNTAGAEKAYAKAATLNPRPADAWHNQGIALYKQGRFTEALACYDQALALNPEAPLVLNSKGFLLQDLDRLEEAHACFTHALRLAPAMNMVRLNLAMMQLKLGIWAEGWDNYEARWTGSTEAIQGTLQRLPGPLPQWRGETGTAGKRLLIITEQGYGDTFQFARYLPLAAQGFASVGFVCSPPTLRLMEWAFGETVALFTQLPADYGNWDLQCPLMSLPRAFGTRPDNIPAETPYLRIPAAPRDYWRRRLEHAAPGRRRIGIAWAGRKELAYDQRRSLSFAQIAPLLDNPCITWVNLQKWAPQDERPTLPQSAAWLDWTDELSDFADTAALVANLDLVISIDSAMVHLAGALNRPVWMLDRFDNEWRWLHHRDDSPWYPSLRIFRQPAFGDWPSVLANVRAALATLTENDVPQQQHAPHTPVAPARSIPPTSGDAPTPEQAMAMASRAQAAGRLAEAEGLLQPLLAAEPAHAHARHLLGVLAWQRGRPEQAVALITQAIAADGSIALFHSNLGEMLRQTGDIDGAIRHGRSAVALDPTMAAAHGNLGIALYDAGDLAAAEASHRRALELTPGALQSLNNLGSILRKRKDLAGAAGWYRSAIARQPDYLESLSNLGAVLVEDGRAEEAVPPLEHALQLRPDYPEALCNLGLARLKTQRLDEADALLQRALQHRPGYAEALRGLARLRYEQGDFGQAETLLHQAIAAAPDTPDAHCQLGGLLAEQERPGEAEAAYRRALALDPDNADAHVGLGNLSLEAGDIDAAEALLKAALTSAPDNIGARFHLAQARKVRPGDVNLAALEALMPTAATLSADRRIPLHYALGKAYDDLRDYDRAFPHFLEGARLKRATLRYDAAADEARARRIAEIVDTDFFARLHGAGNASEVPVFILGMPRSGTTLTEQIIASHPDVFGAGERPELMERVQRPTAGKPAFYPENLAQLDHKTLTAWGDEYLARLVQRAPSARRISDKMPANYLALGLIPLMLPRAKIIHVQRDPVDTCVSCFTRLFNRNQDASYDLAELGRHYAAYARLMQHWRRILPAQQLLEVRYEDIVSDMEGQARRLIAFCGLEWHDACLTFHETRRDVRTASLTQVRQPIYGSSVARWRHYEKHLGPLLAALGEFAPQA